MSVELRRNGSQFRWCIWQDRLSFIFVWIKQLFDFIQAMSVFGKSQGDKYYKGSSKDSSWASAKISMSRDACMLKYCFLYLRRITTFFGKRVSKQRTLCWASSHTRITPPTISKVMDPLPHMVALQPRWVALKTLTNTVRPYTPGIRRTVLSYCSCAVAFDSRPGQVDAVAATACNWKGEEQSSATEIGQRLCCSRVTFSVLPSGSCLSIGKFKDNVR